MSEKYSRIVEDMAEDAFNLHEDAVERDLMRYQILPWARSLPPGIILDVGAGQGIEATHLEANMFPCVALDKAETSLATSYHDKNVYGYADQLPFRNGQFAGALMKDTWILLRPQRRDDTLSELQRTVTKGGSVLVVSHVNPVLTVIYQHDNGRQDHQSFPPTTDWKEAYDAISKKGMVRSMQFPTNLRDLEEHAQKHGFGFAIECTYTIQSSMALENRWSQTPGFVARLTRE